MFDEDLPRPKEITLPRILDPLSVEELEAYIATLKEEISRTEAEITRKDAHRAAAESVFK